MNILYIITSYPPSIGGAQIHLHNLAKLFADKHRVEIVTQLDTTVERWLLDTTLFAPFTNRNYYIDFIPVRQINFSLLDRVKVFPFIMPYYITQKISTGVLSKLFIKEINNRIIMDEIDIVHGCKAGREYLSLAALRLAKFLKVPFVFTPFHHPRWEGWLHRTYLRICQEADALITLTNNEKQRFIQLGVDRNKIHVTGNAPVVSRSYNSEQFKIKYGIKEEMVLFLGQKFSYKGLDILLKAAEIVWNKHPMAKFVFIGPRTNYSRELFKRTENKSNIIEIGSISLEEKTSALAACDILCLPSSQESFGGVFLEAWAFAKPVIGANIYSIKEVIDDKKNGFIVKRSSVDIADKIIYLFDNPAVREDMGKQGYEKLARVYNWDNIAVLTEQVYNSFQ